MLNILNYLRRPEYVWRPRQAFHRIVRGRNRSARREMVTLPWGIKLDVLTDEAIGWDLYCYGVYDRIVPEAIFRLLNEGEVAVDVGANIGQNTSAMARCAGVTGLVISFEPQPDFFTELQTNLDGWRSVKRAPIDLHKVALGVEETSATIWFKSKWNRAAAVLREEALDSSEGGSSAIVEVKRLDDFLESVSEIGICKIDVEGGELKVLQGGIQALRQKKIRDVIFEDFRPQPSDVTQFLRENGFTVYRMDAPWLGPRLIEIAEAERIAPRNFTFNYLATLDPRRARARFRGFGWKCLRSR